MLGSVNGSGDDEQSELGIEVDVWTEDLLQAAVAVRYFH